MISFLGKSCGCTGGITLAKLFSDMIKTVQHLAGHPSVHPSVYPSGATGGGRRRSGRLKYRWGAVGTEAGWGELVDGSGRLLFLIDGYLIANRC
jgi:hypothetical protein